MFIVGTSDTVVGAESSKNWLRLFREHGWFNSRMDLTNLWSKRLPNSPRSS